VSPAFGTGEIGTVGIEVKRFIACNLSHLRAAMEEVSANAIVAILAIRWEFIRRGLLLPYDARNVLFDEIIEVT